MKITKADTYRKWGVPTTLSPRYKHPIEKGVFWYFISLYVRTRDVKKYGVCISCGKPISIDNCDAGHFMPARGCGRDLLFDLRNVNAECSHCNAWDDTHLLGYAEGLDARYGDGSSKELRRRKKEYEDGPALKDWKKAEYEEKIKHIHSLYLAETPDVV